MKTVGYIRVSTDEQAKNGVSLDAQRAKIEAYAQLKDMNLIDIITDSGISAKNLNRQGMQRILAMCEKKEIDAIVVMKLDRMFRNTIDALQTTQMFDRLGISFHSINESIDTQSALGKFFFTLMSSIAEMERNIISERTKTALQHKKANGEKCGGSIPYGCDLDSQTMKLIPNEQEQTVITLCKKYREEGLTLQAICNKLHEKGIKTKQGKEHWKANTVRRILNSL